MFGYHPDFAKIDWSKVEWLKSGQPRQVDFSTRPWPSWASSTRTCCFRTPGLDGHQGFLRADMSYELTIEPCQTIEVEKARPFDAALRAGIWLPHACCHGFVCHLQGAGDR